MTSPDAPPSLAAFVNARLDEAAARAWAVHDVEKCDALLYEEDMAASAADTPDCDCGCPARTLREVAVFRSIAADCTAKLAYPANAPLYNLARRTLASAASIWSDHPDYGAAVLQPRAGALPLFSWQALTVTSRHGA